MTTAWRLLRDSFSYSRGSLLSPALDTLTMGGLGVGFFLFFVIFLPHAADSLHTLFITSFFIFYFVAAPHFAASYQIAYGGFVRRVLGGEEGAGTVMRYLWIGLLVPALLLGYAAFSLSHERETALRYLGYLVNFMFFVVGWHYIKQVYGCVMVTSALQKIYYDRKERIALLLPLYALWIGAYAMLNLGVGVEEFIKVPYHSLNLDALALRLFGVAELSVPAPFPAIVIGPTLNILGFFFYCAMAASFAWLVCVMREKFRRERRLPPAAAVAAFVSIYAWMAPVFRDPYFFYLIPYLHAVQYLPFVLARRRNIALAAMRGAPAAAGGRPGLDMEREERLAAGQLNRLVLAVLVVFPCLLAIEASFGFFGLVLRLYDSFDAGLLALGSPFGLAAAIALATWALYPLGRRLLVMQHPVVRQVCNFFLWACVLGFAGYYALPKLFEFLVPLGEQYSGWLFLFLFTVLLNIHHYFIDNVLWKKDNRPVVHYLFSTRQLQAPAVRAAPSRYAHG